MSSFPEGNAIVYCDHAYGTPNGKTAHGLVRRSLRYRILSVIDSDLAGQDAGLVLDGKEIRIPIVADLSSALRQSSSGGLTPSHFVMGIAPDGGRLEHHARQAIKEAIMQGLHVDSGLHDFLTDDRELMTLAAQHRVRLRDIRKPKPRSELHFFSGKIAEVTSLKIAVLGTDSAVGKRTTAWLLVDMALHDILGKISRLPLWKLLGGWLERMPTSVTIGILPEMETVEKARAWVNQGFKRLKLKGGLDVESDIVRVIKVRETVGNEIALCFDANEGFDLEAALQFIGHTQGTKLEFVEQLLPRDQTELLGIIKKQARVPVMADESVVTPSDLWHCIRGDLVDLINLKLQKVGGLVMANRMNAIAQVAGIGAMVGCMDEVALSIAAGLHFALAQPNVRYADLDGHFDLLDDPTRSAIQLRDGWLVPNDQPGLGWELK